MRLKRQVMNALVISLAAHACFFASSHLVKFTAAMDLLERSKRIFNIGSISDEAFPFKKLVKRGVTYTNVLQFERPELSDDNSPAANKRSQIKQKEFAKDIPEDISMPLDKENSSELMPKDQAKEVQKTDRATRGELVELSHEAGEGMLSEFLEMDKADDIPREFFKSMPGFTPSASGGFIDSLKNKIISGFDKAGTTKIQRKSSHANIGEYLIATLSVFQDPETGEKYFKIAISAGKDAAQLKVMNKEIVFVIDCSLSIQRDRLEGFKSGLEYCLNNLNPGDYFNILAFKERNIWFRAASVAPDKNNIKAALNFVNELTAGETTDAYGALYESLKVKENLHPSYVFFISDGRPTKGITNTVKIIDEIASFNKGKRPVFAFSGGSRVNRYFLDFISYKNRGWTEYADRTYAISKYMRNFYKKIKDPLLLNLRYYVSNLDSEEIFPENLPDFFKNAEFTLYGKYDKQEEFSLQLLGDIDSETDEFIIVGSFDEAISGTKEIARNWAFNKVYYLIGQLKDRGQDEKLIAEIGRLCDKFDIQTPYSELIKR